MQFTGFLWREGEPDHIDIDNGADQDLLVSVGFIHEATNNALIITVEPGGLITMSYRKIVGPDIARPPHHVLGRFDEHGVLEIHEPRLITEQERT